MKKVFCCILCLLALPFVSNAVELQSGIAKYCFEDSTGRIKSIVDLRNNTTPIVSIFTYYNLLSKNGDLHGNEKDDRVVKTNHTKDRLVFECVNDNLKDIVFVKSYWLENGALRHEIKYINNRKDKIFFINNVETVFSKEMLENAYYFGAGYLGPYIPAPKPKTYVRVDEYVQTSKGMVLSNYNDMGSYTNYRVKINDNVVYPWWQSAIGRYRESDDRLYYTPTGWSMCQGTLDVEPNGGSIRYTDCFCFFKGDIYNFFSDVFGKDADFQNDMKQIQPPPDWTLDIFRSEERRVGTEC